MTRRVLVVASPLLFALAFIAMEVTACDDTPRGVQGIDFIDEGGLSTDAGDANVSDAHGPCEETPDPAAFCAQQGGAGTLYTHEIVCIDGAYPYLLDCNAPDATPDAGSQTFCCTTGLI